MPSGVEALEGSRRLPAFARRERCVLPSTLFRLQRLKRAAVGSFFGELGRPQEHCGRSSNPRVTRLEAEFVLVAALQFFPNERVLDLSAPGTDVTSIVLRCSGYRVVRGPRARRAFCSRRRRWWRAPCPCAATSIDCRSPAASMRVYLLVCPLLPLSDEAGGDLVALREATAALQAGQGRLVRTATTRWLRRARGRATFEDRARGRRAAR